MVFVDKQAFALALALAAGVAEAALAKIISFVYLRHGKPGLGLLVRLGFSGRSPSSAGSLSHPLARDPKTLVVAASALAVYATLAAIRSIDTFLVATLPQPVTWTAAGVEPNRSFNMQVVAKSSFFWNITPSDGAAIYDGFRPPFDTTGREWFALAASTPTPRLVAAPPFSAVDGFKNTSDGGNIEGYCFVQQSDFRDLAVPDQHKRDPVLAVGLGFAVREHSIAWTDASRPVMVPLDALPGSRTYAFLGVAPVYRDALAYNLSTQLVKATYTAPPHPPPAVAQQPSVCIYLQTQQLDSLAVVVTPTSPGVHTLTLNTAALNAREKTVFWDIRPCVNVTVFDVDGSDRTANTTTLVATTQVFHVKPPYLARGNASDHALLDVDLWLPGPATNGNVDYVEHKGDLVDAPPALLLAAAVVALAALAVVLAPTLTAANLAFAACASDDGGDAAAAAAGVGWTWAILTERFAHALIARRGHADVDVTDKALRGDVVVEVGAEYRVETVAWKDGEPLGRVVAAAKSAGIPL